MLQIGICGIVHALDVLWYLQAVKAQARDAERAQKEAERAAKEAERLAKEAEKAKSKEAREAEKAEKEAEKARKAAEAAQKKESGAAKQKGFQDAKHLHKSQNLMMVRFAQGCWGSAIPNISYSRKAAML
jgi:sRNA-binding protein